ncbi:MULTISPECIES: exodeoxyribonuclease VII small subunit [unclassified Methylophilus]|jgi:exodeoxyribonuclease VII small subunit|uniref:exodeoxyribonuclease VII small subunit n=1 Tax=unclassified Methylophilus TaxID=2630143 RepID=UPI0006F5C47C|nr:MULTISPECIES: exodeoxyribonuclease VII small subunit [unclassified Methylophilus]KQT43990.1 exodeoxyribonuclease VII small subunit [Methylophilus sp. Leaf416]KQT59474.1 exodeoxyribonuclease VII small subunit [Methylophilus sp. Leaf459]
MSVSKKSPDVASDSQTFAQRMTALETIVRNMESGELPLEDALKAYADGMQLLQACQTSLQQAEQTVLILNQQQQLKPFELE